MKIVYPTRSKFLKKFEEIFHENKEKLAVGGLINVMLPPGGYAGEVTVVIDKENKKEFNTDWIGSDSSRFPARIKAAASALKNQNCFGEFKVTHNEGILEISKLPAIATITSLLKKITKSQHSDGVRINKTYHDLFNPPGSMYYVVKGESRNIEIEFNNKKFAAKYLHENPHDVDREMQSIRFSKKLMEEFQLISPNLQGSFLIELGANPNQFLFRYVGDSEKDEIIAVSFESLEIGKAYERPFLANLWGYKGYQAISKGVVTPKEAKKIILFVTKEKQQALTQYNDFIDSDLLFWEGEKKHGSDRRITNAAKNGEDIHLFYREIHHSPFEYHGLIHLLDYQINKDEASEFIFKIGGIQHPPDVLKDIDDHKIEFKNLKKTEQDSIVKSRIGQGDFRKNLIRVWGGCAVTGVKKLSILKASHIKPWRVATNQERLDPFNGLLLAPNLDELFDKGLITFTNKGSIKISKLVSPEDLELLNVHNELCLRSIKPASEPYLKFHRENIFEK